MDTTTAAQQAGVTVDTIRVWARMGAVRATKRFGRWVIDTTSLARRIAMGTKPTPKRRATTVKQTDITITTEGSHIYVEAPFSRAANTDYKSLGGRWDAPRRAWRFAARDLDKVRDTLQDHFGYDDRPIETVDVRIDLEGEYGRGDSSVATVTMFGRDILTRHGRDEPVRLGKDVLRLEGEFDPSAGSMRYPAIGDVDGIVLEVRGVPANHPDLDDDEVTVLSTPEPVDTTRAALEAERAALVARLAEIDAQLAN